MADSEVRQKFEAWLGLETCPVHSDESAEKNAWYGFEAGMRAGEIAMREKAVKVARDEGDVPREDGGNFARQDACDNVARAIRALPLSGAEESAEKTTDGRH